MSMVHTNEPAGVTIRTILRDLAESRSLDLEVLAGAEGLDRRITIPHTQKTGLALSGFDAYLREGRVLVFGESEIRYLESLDHDARVEVLQRILGYALPCVLVTDGFDPPAEVPIESDRAQVPLLRTRAATPEAMSRLSSVLDTYLSARGIIHGVLLDILGLGVLVVGESGIGKSECALNLVVRGHRLVADDAVELRCRAQSFVMGTCPELTRNHMEIRGLGMINVQDMFGVASTRTSKRVELVVQLERWEPGREYQSAWRRRQFLRTARNPHPDGTDAGRARPERRNPRRGRGSKPVAAERAGTTPPAGSSSASTAGSSSRRSMAMRTSSRERNL